MLSSVQEYASPAELVKVITGARWLPHRAQEAFHLEQVLEAHLPLKVAQPLPESHNDQLDSNLPTLSTSRNSSVSLRRKLLLEDLSKATLHTSSQSSTSDPNERSGLPGWASCSLWLHS